MANKTARASNSQQVFITALIWGLWLAAAIAVVGGAIAFFAVGLSGLVSAAIGAGIAAAFSALTALAVLFGGRLPLGGFYAVVMGGWLLKMLVFLGVIALLNGVEGINRPTIFFSIVASVLGGLIIDAIVVTRSRIPVVEN